MPTFNAQTLPADDNINPYAFAVELRGEYFVQKGKMIAYYGADALRVALGRVVRPVDRRLLRLAAVRA